MKIMIFLGAINMFLAVALGAFGAHGLEGKVSERMLANWQTGSSYHMTHALGLLLIGLVAKFTGSSPLVMTGGWFILAGIIIFSGSLYLMTLTDVTKLGMITPIGGVSFLIGWILIAVAALKTI
ncbi:DUF423 domain-containing protein [Mechercharimyces sp. CAU 1602]|uniref:DUF423 domain-containing protein n=1 Tax=Mechercharimyces sp. CAU 1602 TaxID=2973933 RepID=UPI00216219B3|nr:DUF423 domain-containing protein [Mechercharimyces sp. CAU 1602]MCS1352155.1 DUF423 domain-containing protein [Mechercharimyces sp. CAU 1602]